MNLLFKRIITFSLALVMVFSLIPGAGAYYNHSDWAIPELTAMEELGLIPDSLINDDMKSGISRMEMCQTAVLACEKILGEELPLPENHPFTDTFDPSAEKAWLAGIVSGDGNGTYRPNDMLKRAEFFKIIGNFITFVGYAVTEADYADLSRFSDVGTLPEWAKESTQLAVGLGIVNGSGNKLSWNNSTSCEEGLALFYRTYQVVTADAEEDLPPEESLPEETEPVPTEPEPTEPEPTEPEPTEPEPTEPEPTEPEPTEPEPTEPEPTEPEPTEPEPTEPEPTEPEPTDPTEPEYDGDFINLASWAEDAVRAMDEMGLVPNAVKASPMNGIITRQHMCQIIMRTYKQLMGITDSDLGTPDDPFTDTDDVDVLNACRLGIVNGTGNGKFSPDDPITRQDFFVMSARFLGAIGYPDSDDESCDLSRFVDANEISGYAKASTRLLVSIGAVSGNNKNELCPQDEIVCQEAILVFHRIYDFTGTWFTPGVPPAEKPDENTELRNTIVEFALQFVGYPYVYAGKSPEDGFDCSGFVYYVYKQFGYILNPGATNQWNSLSDTIIAKSNLRPGDLVFFSDNGEVSGMTHVGLYIGDGKMVHAANPSKGVIITELTESYYFERYLGAKRVID